MKDNEEKLKQNQSSEDVKNGEKDLEKEKINKRF